MEHHPTEDKGWRSAVPHAAQAEDTDQQGQLLSPLVWFPSERHVYIIPKPRREGDMPPMPDTPEATLPA